MKTVFSSVGPIVVAVNGGEGGGAEEARNARDAY